MSDKVILQLTDKLSHAITKVAPTAWQAMVNVKHIDSIMSLISAGALITLLLTICVIAIIVARKNLSEISYISEDNVKRLAKCHTDADLFRTHIYVRNDSKNETLGMAGVVVAIATGVVATLTAVSVILSTWTWVGVFYPNLAVTHDIIVKVLGN